MKRVFPLSVLVSEWSEYKNENLYRPSSTFSPHIYTESRRSSSGEYMQRSYAQHDAIRFVLDLCCAYALLVQTQHTVAAVIPRRCWNFSALQRCALHNTPSRSFTLVYIANISRRTKWIYMKSEIKQIDFVFVRHESGFLRESVFKRNFNDNIQTVRRVSLHTQSSARRKSFAYICDRPQSKLESLESRES